MVIEDNGKKYNSVEEYMEELFDVRLEPHHIIKFKHVFGATGSTLKIQPARDGLTRQLIGVKMLSDDQKRKVTYFVDENTTFELKPGSYLDLGNIIDCINWKWIQHSRGIGLSRQDADSKVDVYFYVHDEAKESQKSLAHTDAIFEAIGYVKSISDSDLAATARLLGEKLDSLAPEAIREFLYSKAKHTSMEEVKKILALKEDPDTTIKKRINALVDKGLIKIINGVYRFYKIDLGSGLEQTVLFFKNKQNKDIVDTMFKALYPELYDTSIYTPTDMRLTPDHVSQTIQLQAEQQKKDALEEAKNDLETKLAASKKK